MSRKGEIYYIEENVTEKERKRMREREKERERCSKNDTGVIIHSPDDNQKCE